MESTPPTVAQPLAAEFDQLQSQLKGQLHTGSLMRRLYATDASAYQQMPLAVAIPETTEDIRQLILFADRHGVGLIPRTAGTSLAGQVVGGGIVVDVSRHFTQVLEIDPIERTVWVEPGVIRNELNLALKPHGMLFGPETSTQNRAMIGGMVGNNSCGSNSIKYGSTREHLLEIEGFLSDGSHVTFGQLTVEEFDAKCNGPASLETTIYQQIREMLSDEANRQEIEREFPKPSIPRRNTGYAIDLLMDAEVFDRSTTKQFNFCKLIAGSEGTLFFATRIKLNCLPLPPPISGLICAHFETVDESLRATQIAVKHDCYACELIDHYILECTERSIEHRENRFFVQGKPGAIIVVDIRGQSQAEVQGVCDRIISQMQAAGLGYAYPVLFGDDTERIWDLRKAGLGLLGNMPGDAKPAPVVEDTCVDVDDLPEYIAEFNRRLKERFGLDCVHYAHAGSGEIHLRPVINLKTPEGNQQFRKVAQTIAELVKHYRGSLSGEHGDGRLRGEFLKQMIGARNYELVRQVKQTWDPKGVFNPNKIVNTPPMNTSLRYTPGQKTKQPKTLFDFSANFGILGAAEMCNGSGDCRKTELSGGTMCPSYMATRDEKHTTRARANTLRQIIMDSDAANPLDSDEIKEVMDLCLSCKGCKKECPSTVDMAKLKAEFQQHYYDAHGVPRRARLIADFFNKQKLAARLPWLWNLMFGTPAIRKQLNYLTGFHPDRTIPLLPNQTLSTWHAKHKPHKNAGNVGRVLFFNDEFTNFHDPKIGIAAINLLEHLGYDVAVAPIEESGRTWLSKGMLREAKQRIDYNLQVLKGAMRDGIRMIGVEPSAILTFRDETMELAEPELRPIAHEIAPRCLMFEEFFQQEMQAGKITADSFTDQAKSIHLHGHCFQKALAGQSASIAALNLPRNYTVKTIPSGCCGMAGSFGYETEHYDVSMKIGELVLFPRIRELPSDVLLAAPGTSCRHQIHDGTRRKAMHPAEILWEALQK
ncbi:FAD-binding oxidoreductase [Blastopirellula marina]|uniref:FAD-binding oxidoreductase n=1 Tax=Blastopirellula marina TaxID=124 RepID=A0A2S8F0V5_9BACT|nr:MULTISPECIES: FAD-binding and (Fe-S)-binding domain-containing protein [Pirellulaceae]PQO25769.1 FAD-binding oxidoreductase [Blastopirellula marina]RCS43452.1 FAD-binding oxidoreductase [Bremerella cremea]